MISLRVSHPLPSLWNGISGEFEISVDEGGTWKTTVTVTGAWVGVFLH